MRINTPDKDKSSGRTSQQMIDAPHKAVYVWKDKDLWYPERLAWKLHRRDLKIVSPEQFCKHCRNKYYNRPIVTDHALVDITGEFTVVVEKLNERNS